MLINFCRKCLETTVTCSTISSDGYEVTNLVSDSDKGFLVYSCIKPPINIDFTFACDIEISHILIWPSVGAQKSSGFELSVKSNAEWSKEYKRVSTAYLNSTESGILFYRRDINQKNAVAPNNFLQRYIHISDQRSVNCVRNLRLSIVKTENSVPAIGLVEIWGKVSAFCSNDAIAHVLTLWQNSFTDQTKYDSKKLDASPKKNNIENNAGSSKEEPFDIPDNFLDPITYNIMIQPIVLPSGAIIDQSTLEKHAKSEATWGRPLSDPFTGVPLNESRKPIIASALKARIDKFLLDNSNRREIKNVPRLSGYKQSLVSLHNRPLELSEITSQTGVTTNNFTTMESRKTHSDLFFHTSFVLSSKQPNNTSRPVIPQEPQSHKLPVIPVHSKRVIANTHFKTAKIKKFTDPIIRKEMNNIVNEKIDNSKMESHLDLSVQRALATLQRFDRVGELNSQYCVKNCNCTTKMFYSLPCRHIVCKEVLISVNNSECPICDSRFNSADVERIHTHLKIN